MSWSCLRHYSGLINTNVLTHFGSLKIPRHLVSGCFCANLAILAKNSHLDPLFLPSAPLLSYWPVPFDSCEASSSKWPPHTFAWTKRRKEVNWKNRGGGYRGIEIHKPWGLNSIHHSALLERRGTVRLSSFHTISVYPRKC